MFSKTIGASLTICSLILHGHAHAAIAPAFGVKGSPTRSDVQRPSTSKPCGNIPLSEIDASTAVPADSQGHVDITVTNFNLGADGSRKVTAKVSADGSGNDLREATIIENGDAAPTNFGSQPVIIQLPAGTKCTGGKRGNLCLMTVQTTAGFGNCVAVTQGRATAAGATAGAPASAHATAAAACPAETNKSTSTQVAKAAKGKKCQGRDNGDKAMDGKRKGKGNNVKGGKGAGSKGMGKDGKKEDGNEDGSKELGNGGTDQGDNDEGAKGKSTSRAAAMGKVEMPASP